MGMWVNSDMWEKLKGAKGGFYHGLSLEELRVLMIKLGRKRKAIQYPAEKQPPFGLSLVAPFLTDKQGKTHLGAYLVDYDREAHTAKALWIIKPNLHQDV